jgi:hypothetical protein
MIEVRLNPCHSFSFPPSVLCNLVFPGHSESKGDGRITLILFFLVPTIFFSFEELISTDRLLFGSLFRSHLWIFSRTCISYLLSSESLSGAGSKKESMNRLYSTSSSSVDVKMILSLRERNKVLFPNGACPLLHQQQFVLIFVTDGRGHPTKAFLEPSFVKEFSFPNAHCG